jgi:hypothetical protein
MQVVQQEKTTLCVSCWTMSLLLHGLISGQEQIKGTVARLVASIPISRWEPTVAMNDCKRCCMSYLSLVFVSRRPSAVGIGTFHFHNDGF